MSKGTGSTKRGTTVRNVYHDLMSIHLGLSKEEDSFELLSEHRDVPYHTHPAHRHGMRFVEYGFSARPAHEGESQLVFAESDLWPRAFVPIHAVTDAFFNAYQLKWQQHIMPNWLSGAYEQVAAHQRDMQHRLEAVEKVLAVLCTKTGSPEAINTLGISTGRAEPRPSAQQLQQRLDDLAEYVPTLASVFRDIFNAEASVSLRLEVSSELPLVAVMDTTDADNDTVAAARRAGARMKFYEAVTNILSDELADLVDFEFVFA